MKSFALILSALALSASSTFALEEAASSTQSPASTAGESKRPRKALDPEKIFKRLDSNSDGSVTLEEFKAGPRAQKAPERAEKMFKRRDTDGNGSLSLEELKTTPERGSKKKKNAK